MLDVRECCARVSPQEASIIQKVRLNAVDVKVQRKRDRHAKVKSHPLRQDPPQSTSQLRGPKFPTLVSQSPPPSSWPCETTLLNSALPHISAVLNSTCKVIMYLHKSPQTTKISISNLSLPHPIAAPDVWGKQKEQPALLNVSLTLRGSGFDSAASLDKLDDSTIHYGTLAKKLRAGCTAGMDVLGLIAASEKGISEMGMKGNGRFIVQEAKVEVGLCKASMFGEEVKIASVKRYGVDGKVESSRWGFEVEEVKVMVLVGVNGYERQARQPLVVSFGVWFEGEGKMEGLFGLESLAVEVSYQPSNVDGPGTNE